MKKNMGSTDKWIRLIAGVLIGVAGIYFKTWWGLVGIVLIGTSLLNWCPIYHLFGISTRKQH